MTKGKKDGPKWMKKHLPQEFLSSEVFVFNIILPSGHKMSINLTDDIDIDLETLESHLEEIPAQYVFWAAVYSEMKSKVSVLETQVSVRKAILARETLEQFRARNIRITDKQFVRIIGHDDKLTKLEAKLLIAHKQAGKIYHMVEAIRIRSEHCRSLAGFKRQEREQSGQQT